MSILFLIACLHYIIDIFVTYFVLYRYIHITYVCVCFSLRKMEIEEIEIEETPFERILDRKYLCTFPNVALPLNSIDYIFIQL